jgi:DNA-binding FadR family transcriptional regulator
MTDNENSSIMRAEESAPGGGFAKVFSFLRERLLEGTIRSGDRLVPERDLAVQLGVSRPIVREALRALSMIGVVEIRGRVGTIVRTPDISVLGDFFAFSLAQQPDIIDDVMQARIAIECQAIRLACRNASTSDIERFRLALEAIESTIRDATDGAQADFDFHLAIVRASKSNTLINLYTAMATLLLRSHRERRHFIQVDHAFNRYVVEDHHRIFAAVIGRDEDQADKVLREHFRIGDQYRRRAAIEAVKPASTYTKKNREIVK